MLIEVSWTRRSLGQGHQLQLGIIVAGLTQRRGRDLEKWVSAAGARAELRCFITGLCRDRGAIAAGLTVTWNFGSPGCSP